MTMVARELRLLDGLLDEKACLKAEVLGWIIRWERLLDLAPIQLLFKILTFLQAQTHIVKDQDLDV